LGASPWNYQTILLLKLEVMGDGDRHYLQFKQQYLADSLDTVIPTLALWRTFLVYLGITKCLNLRSPSLLSPDRFNEKCILRGWERKRLFVAMLPIVEKLLLP
jgi:hypothetical protein